MAGFYENFRRWRDTRILRLALWGEQFLRRQASQVPPDHSDVAVRIVQRADHIADLITEREGWMAARYSDRGQAS